MRAAVPFQTFHTPVANSIIDAAKRLGVGRTTIYELIGSRDLRTIKIVSRTLIPESELQRCRCCSPAPAVPAIRSWKRKSATASQSHPTRIAVALPQDGDREGPKVCLAQAQRRLPNGVASGVVFAAAHLEGAAPGKRKVQA